MLSIIFLERPEDRVVTSPIVSGFKEFHALRFSEGAVTEYLKQSEMMCGLWQVTRSHTFFFNLFKDRKADGQTISLTDKPVHD